MIYEITLSNGRGDHVEMIVEAETAVEAKAVALGHLKTLPQFDILPAVNSGDSD